MSTEDPKWMMLLRENVKTLGLRAVARQVGYSHSTLSAVLSGSYGGGKKVDLGRIKAAVEGAFLAQVVDCPVVGELARIRCLEHQRRPLMFTSPMRVQFYRACRSGCPHSLLEELGPAELP